MKDKQAKYPQLRFKGFTDPWVQRSFKTLYKKVIEKNDLSFESDRIISVANMYYKPNDSKSDEKYMETYNIFRLGDIAFEGHKSKNFAYGRFVENTIGDGIVSHVFDVFRPISEYDLNYWKYFIHYEDIMGQKLRMSTTKATMMNNLVSKDFLKQSVLVPNLDEQQKIGTFFKQLDHLITLHQRKLAKLKELKQGYLQKLFPKNGSKFPRLRFAGFADAWEQRKLGDITKISTGKLDANAMVENGKYDFYTSGIKKYRIDVAAFEGPSITIAGNGATVGYMHLADNKFNAYQRTYVLQEFLVDRSFIFSEIGNKLPKKIKQEARTGNIPYIVMDMLTELKLSIPQNNSEQQKIGSFFKQLDDTIDLHQRKLEKLQELKKGYLQKMFV
ncbi:restriction endonuclease subunit S [Companilactobacillus ginsenosidimutans]|uniref:Restriction endonuclease subunit S n=1 Tax=Companilactobacillus ginsenosidimutans TaxID=1007676 RepID=A0A0H4QH60_9LACO|nr:restriction endonuclease subunit S [Companilactobacillus ginsenosidimutans]AKP66361.1 restriction endonuclease subunit S [Companilactobacillus ginsenosidimutans]